jgi:predicted transcriptional regulator
MTNDDARSNAERFLDAYAIIEHEMSVMAKETKYIPFSQLLYKCAQKSWVVSKNQQELREYNELRNAIVHLRDGNEEIIAQPTDRVTRDIERIAALLHKSEKLMAYASAPVKTVSPTDSIRGAYTVMRHLDSSKVPVYNNGSYYGMIQMENICRWAMESHDETEHVKDLITTSKRARVVFLPETAHVVDAMQAFDQAMRHGAVLLAVIMTENGSPKEKPLGIVTVQDLPQILDALV